MTPIRPLYILAVSTHIYAFYILFLKRYSNIQPLLAKALFCLSGQKTTLLVLLLVYIKIISVSCMPDFLLMYDSFAILDISSSPGWGNLVHIFDASLYLGKVDMTTM